MRIIAWNVAHQEAGRKKYGDAISKRLLVPAERLVKALVDLEADLVFLSEYRRSESQQRDEDTQLALAGYRVARTMVIPRESPADRRKRDNQTLVAARQTEPIRIVPSAADNAPEYALDNYCHVVRCGLEVVGLRLPAYEGRRDEVRRQNDAHWKWLNRTLRPLVGGHSIVLGNVNRDPDSSEQSEFFTRMQDAGWRTKRPVGHPWSYRNRSLRKDDQEHRGTRIDHAFFGQAFELAEVQVEYFAATRNDELTGSVTAISNHAAIGVDVPAQYMKNGQPEKNLR